jgi:peptide/nickel transport system permease protein
MGAYLARRFALMILMLFLVTVAVFFLFSLVPTDPAALTCGKSCTPQIIEANRERLGLADPLYIQYWEFLKGIFVGRTYAEGTPVEFSCAAPALGYSYRKNECVTTLIVDRFPVTMQLALGAFVIWMVVGIISGIYAALRRGRWQDRTIVGLALVGYSFPTFFIGLLLLFFVVIQWQLLPFPYYVPFTDDPVRWFQTMILPWITIAMVFAAFYTRLTRTQMLETLGEDYIRTARAKGLSERVVIRKHAFRAGLTPLVTAAGLDLAGLLGGAVVTEAVFNLPGLGRLAIESVQDYDLPVIVGTVVVVATFVIVANLIVDLLYAAIDPRVRIA